MEEHEELPANDIVPVTICEDLRFPTEFVSAVVACEQALLPEALPLASALAPTATELVSST
jgi:predicted amidohydrolase